MFVSLTSGLFPSFEKMSQTYWKYVHVECRCVVIISHRIHLSMKKNEPYNDAL